ncbi:MAG: OmpA family protein, partial [Elusimicrobia bacterium]|nr:OmpA family protein [Elusimicrobiota bacterium]
TPAAGPGAPGGEKAPAENKPASGTVNYTITFAKGTQQMSADADRTIGRVVESLQAYPRENLNIVGYASQAEPDAQKLASDRANVVSGLLVNRYSVDPARIRSESKVVSEERYEVDIFSVAARE